MKRALHILFYLLLFNAGTALSQSFNVGFLFNPGTTIGGEYMMPAAINDSVDFEMYGFRLQNSLPLKTKFGIKGLTLKDFSFKKLDAKASQVFLNYGLSVNKPSASENNPFDPLYKGNIGITAVTASIRNGIWIYSANLFAVENETTLKSSFTPNFRGYVANLKTKNLRTFYFYGGGILANQGRIIPFPVLGLRTPISGKLKAEIILPMQARFFYKFNVKTSLDAVAYFNGINTVYRSGSPFNGGDNSTNLRQLKTYLALNTKLGKHYKLRLEGGYVMLQQLYEWDTKTSTDLANAPYIGVSINYNWGKSVFGNYMNRTE